jgi:pantoate--beta-alanine ligase
LALAERAARENKVVVVSIFVNPTQFNNPQDLALYPHTLDQDMKLLATLLPLGTPIWVYAPNAEDLYDQAVVARSFDFQGLDTVFEGADRPGHFNGVGTVVSLLWKAVPAQRVYFGEKDYQQLCVVKALKRMENHSLEIIPCPIVRESNGLAMSSRNERLTAAQRQRAAWIYQTLQEVAQQASASAPNRLSPDELRNLVAKKAQEAPDFEIAYFDIVHEGGVNRVTQWSAGARYRALIAVAFHGVRLIDNIAL